MEIGKLKASRAGHKRAVTRLIRKAEEEENLNAEEKSELLETLAEKQRTISALNEEIFALLEEKDVEEEILQTDEYKFDTNIKIRQIRKKYSTPATTPCPSTSQNEPNYQSNSNENINQHSSIPYMAQMYPYPSSSNNSHHLPKLTLPTFNGDKLTWQTFWDSYESAVHFNTSLTNVQKFSYLKAQLTGSAESTIEGLPLTNTNYMEAIKLLQERFAQPHKISNAYMQALLELPAPVNTLASLRAYYDKQEAYIRGLESLGRAGDSYGALLIPIILNKLPAEITNNLAREHGSDDWELNDLRRGILKEITILESTQRGALPRATSNTFQPTASFLTSVSKKGKQITYQKFNARDEQKATNIRQKPCIFCQNLHDPAKCPNVADFESRLSVVKEKKLCFNCFGAHRSFECKSRFRCRKCNKKHHTSLCHENQNASTSKTQKETPVNAVVTADNDVPAAAASLHSSTGSTVQSRSNVLLKTAVAPVWGIQCIDSNILFDEGAQRSFITEELASKLGAEIIDTETIHLSAFGNTEHKVRHLPRARIYVESITGTKIRMEVLVVPTIASPLATTMTNDIKNLKYLRELRLAHAVTDDSAFTISLLVGADYYWDFVEDDVIRGNGPTAVKSKLGYLLFSTSS